VPENVQDPRNLGIYDQGVMPCSHRYELVLADAASIVKNHIRIGMPRDQASRSLEAEDCAPDISVNDICIESVALDSSTHLCESLFRRDGAFAQHFQDSLSRTSGMGPFEAPHLIEI
jgi:hypothetical protein